MLIFLQKVVPTLIMKVTTKWIRPSGIMTQNPQATIPVDNFSGSMSHVMKDLALCLWWGNLFWNYLVKSGAGVLDKLSPSEKKHGPISRQETISHLNGPAHLSIMQRQASPAVAVNEAIQGWLESTNTERQKKTPWPREIFHFVIGSSSKSIIKSATSGGPQDHSIAGARDRKQGWGWGIFDRSSSILHR